MSGLAKGLDCIRKKRLNSLNSYVCGALGVSSSDVGTTKAMVDLVNAVFEADIVFDGNRANAIDAMFGYVTGLTRQQRKRLRKKNLLKVPYRMKGVNGARRRAMLQREEFYAPENASKRQAKDAALLAEAKAAKKVGKSPTSQAKDDFYKSWEWRTLRMEVLKEHGRSCQCCGAEPGMKTPAGEPVRICVDHIKPLSKFWKLRLDRTNLQVLCDECNQGKGNWDQTDFRPHSGPDEWITDTDDVDPMILDQLKVGTIQ